MADSLLVDTSGVVDADPSTNECRSFETTIRPIFDAFCVQCHQGLNAKRGLDLSDGKAIASLANVPSSYDSSKVLVVPGDSTASFLMHKLMGTADYGFQMPFGDDLSNAQVTLIGQWIDVGAHTEQYDCPGEDKDVSEPADTNEPVDEDSQAFEDVGPPDASDVVLPPADPGSSDVPAPEDVTDGSSLDVSDDDTQTIADAGSGDDTDTDELTDAAIGDDVGESLDVVGTDDTIVPTDTGGEGDSGSLTCNSFEADIQPIFDKACVGCHQGAAASMGLDLASGNALAAVVNVPSGWDASQVLVVPGSSAQSFLVEKLLATPSFGQQMPLGQPLTANEVASVSAWIDAGATAEPYNCQGGGPVDSDTSAPSDDVEADTTAVTDSGTAGDAFTEDAVDKDVPDAVIDDVEGPEDITVTEDTEQDAGSVVCNSFALDVQPILDSFCVQCHQGPAAQMGLDLASGNAIDAVVNVSSALNAALVLVSPGNAAGSFLVQKLLPAPAVGSQMPIGPPLSAQDINTITAWVDAGAVTGSYNCTGGEPGNQDTSSPPQDTQDPEDAGGEDDTGSEDAGSVQDTAVEDVFNGAEDSGSSQDAQEPQDSGTEDAGSELQCSSFDVDIQPILDAACVGCHQGQTAQMGLDLSAGNAVAAVVGVSSLLNASLTLVTPGDSASSFFLDKLGDSPAAGQKMPIGGTLTGVEIAAIDAWIDAGATTQPYNCSGGNPGDADTSVEPDVAVEDTSSTDDAGVAVDAGAPEDTGVSQDTADIASQDTEPPAEDTAPQPCTTPLAVQASKSLVATFDWVNLTISGGTGNYNVALLNNASGATLNSKNWTYLSGGTPAVTDVVRITDLGCTDVVDISIAVVSTPELTPTTATLPTSSCLTFTATGGSGNFNFAIMSTTPIGSINSAGLYTAGNQNGMDIIRVTDLETGRVVDANVYVTNTATFKFESPQYFIAMGGYVKPTFDIKGGQFSLNTTSQAVEIDGGLIKAVAPGVATVTATDPSIGCLGENGLGQAVTTTTITVVDAIPVPSEKWFQSYAHHYRVVGPGDVTGDGIRDVIVSDATAHVTGASSGGVHVFSGAAGGLNAKPVMSLSGTESNGNYGSDVAVADVTGDGLDDLLIGAMREDSAGPDSGTVYIYPGLSGGLFDKQNPVLLKGTSQAWFGASLATCDFNGDGFMDLAVGAPESHSFLPYVIYRGYVAVFYGSANGIPTIPNGTIYGGIPSQTGGWGGIDYLRMGARLAPGDFDGDGVCDLAVATENDNASAVAPYTNGAVFLFRGSQGLGLNYTPSRHWLTTHDDRGFADDIAMADVNGDGKDDLLVGHGEAYATQPKSSSDIYVFAGTALGTTPEIVAVTTEQADWLSSGTPGGESNGALSLDVGDYNGDGIIDLIHSGLVDDQIYIHYGLTTGYFDSSPSQTITGPDEGFGGDIGFVGDVTGDSQGDLVVCQNGYSANPSAIGAVFQASLDPNSTPLKALDVPMRASNSQNGSGVAFVDLTGDGQDDLIIGAPGGYAGLPSTEQRGMAYGFSGTATGVSTSPSWTWEGAIGNWGRFGSDVNPVGDFDNDGTEDIVVTNTNTRRAWGTGWWGLPPHVIVPTECDPGQVVSGIGSASVFSGVSQGQPNSIPTFKIFGSQNSNQSGGLANRTLARGGFDFNGDGFSDLAYAEPYRNGTNGGNRTGRVEIYLGRAAIIDKTQVLCTPEGVFEGETNSLLGAQIVPMGDLDNDGCDEIVIAAPQAGSSYIGSAGWDGRLFLLYGWGSNCATTTKRVATIGAGATEGAMGLGLDGGHDIDGDNIPDLVVSEPYYHVDGTRFGRVIVVMGAWVKAIVPDIITGSILPSSPPSMQKVELAYNAPVSIVGTDGYYIDLALWVSAPEQPYGAYTAGFGDSVMFVPGIGDNGVGIAIGAPKMDYFSSPQSGEVRVYAWSNTTNTSGSNLTLSAVFTGQTWKKGSRLGKSLSVGTVGGKATVAVGGPFADPTNQPEQVDNGAVYLLQLEP